MRPASSTPSAWHPIEEAIIKHIQRYHLTTPEAACAAEVRGMTDPLVATQRLRALAKRGILRRGPLDAEQTCYMLSAEARRQLGNDDDDHHQQQQQAPSQQTKVQHLAFLLFCCLHAAQRVRLTADDLKERFPDLYRQHHSSHYYLSSSGPTPCLGFLRVDAGHRGRWDRIVAKVSDDIRWHLSLPVVTELLRTGAFEITVITPLPDKAQRIHEALSLQQEVLPIPVHCVAMPELVNLIRPVPD
jgi:hypothetical protein